MFDPLKSVIRRWTNWPVRSCSCRQYALLMSLTFGVLVKNVC